MSGLLWVILIALSVVSGECALWFTERRNEQIAQVFLLACTLFGMLAGLALAGVSFHGVVS